MFPFSFFKQSNSLKNHHSFTSGSFFKYRGGFTLVEILIVLVAIGILSAVIYPNIIGHMERSRDADRIVSIHSLSLGLKSYHTDYNAYPYHTIDCGGDTQNNTCTNSNYIPGCFPEDTMKVYTKATHRSPIAQYDEGCGMNGRFAYGSNDSGSAYILLSTMEYKRSGNYSLLPSETLDGFTGSINEQSLAKAQTKIQDKSGKYYILSEGFVFDESTLITKNEDGSNNSGNNNTGNNSNNNENSNGNNNTGSNIEKEFCNLGKNSDGIYGIKKARVVQISRNLFMIYSIIATLPKYEVFTHSIESNSGITSGYHMGTGEEKEYLIEDIISAGNRLKLGFGDQFFCAFSLPVQ